MAAAAAGSAVGGIVGNLLGPLGQASTGTSRPGFLLRPGQKKVFDRFTSTALESAVGGGLSSRERGDITTRAFEDIERSTGRGRENIMDALARSGLGGGVAGRSFGNLEAGRITARSGALSSIEELSQNLKTQRIAELLGLTGISPAAAGQITRQESAPQMRKRTIADPLGVFSGSKFQF